MSGQGQDRNNCSREGAAETGGARQVALDTLPDVKREEMLTIVDQAIIGFSELYANMAMKTAIHGANPVAELVAFRRRISGAVDSSVHGGIDKIEFHGRMSEIFRRVRDSHTRYWATSLPNRSLYLPITIERYVTQSNEGATASSETTYIVTKAAPDLPKGCRLKPGTEVTHWNGIPIDRAVDVFADLQPGGNAYHRQALAMNYLTQRPLKACPIPDEDWVVLTAKDGNERFECRFGWLPFDAEKVSFGMSADADPGLAAVQASRCNLYRKEKPPKDRMRSTYGNIEYWAIPRGNGKAPIAYLRIFNFMPKDAEGNLVGPKEQVSEFLRIVYGLRKCKGALGGIILDIRGNAGGNTPTAEQLLQEFSSKSIRPVHFQVRATPLALRVVSGQTQSTGVEGLKQAINIGAYFGPAQPLVPGGGPTVPKCRIKETVVLVVDALTYSAAAIFAAQFQDHSIGDIVSTDDNLGGGGAQVFSHQDVVRYERKVPKDKSAANGLTLKCLPKHVFMTWAFRQAIRRSEGGEWPLEDFGLSPTDVRHLTRDDLLHGNCDMIGSIVKDKFGS
jgi:hypothetical protein